MFYLIHKGPILILVTVTYQHPQESCRTKALGRQIQIFIFLNFFSFAWKLIVKKVVTQFLAAQCT